jgi:hypothetical protein
MDSERSFKRFAAIAAISTLPVALGNLVTMLAAVRFDLNGISNPLILLQQGVDSAVWWRWAMVLDVLGYYLLIVPSILVLRSGLREQGRSWLELAVLCLLAYCLIGAMGGAILAAAIPPLIRAYATPGPHREVLQTVFNGYSDSVYRGLWNLLEELLAGIGWIVLGRILRSGHNLLGTVTMLLGCACVVDSIGTAANVGAIATLGLTAYLFLAPAWAVWLGTLLLRDRGPFTPGEASPRARPRRVLAEATPT